MINKRTNHRTKKKKILNHLIEVFRTVNILSTKSIKQLNKLENLKHGSPGGQLASNRNTHCNLKANPHTQNITKEIKFKSKANILFLAAETISNLIFLITQSPIKPWTDMKYKIQTFFYFPAASRQPNRGWGSRHAKWEKWVNLRCGQLSHDDEIKKDLESWGLDETWWIRSI